MFKNLSTNQVSLLISLSIGLINVVIQILFAYMGKGSLEPGLAFLFFLITFSTSFIVVKFLLDNFVYHKIKLIYKIIRRFKVDKDTSSDLGIGITTNYRLDDVRSDVVNWAKTTQAELRDLKELENYRRNYVGNLSHELKTPVFAAEGFIHTLLDGGLEDDDINKTYLNRAMNNINRIKNIVEDLEIINKLESGKFTMNMSKFDIKDLVAKVFENLEVLANEKNIDLDFKEGANKPILVEADKENIRQVIVNLVTNSIKYGKENGYIKVSIYSLDKSILVEVSDDGIGISEEHLNHVFDRFYRVDQSRSRARGGSGLGLAIVKHIIEAHGETINLRSTSSIGSTFGFTLKKAS